MAEHSTIEWTDATWNPITGCSVISPGCTNCYAMGLAGTRLRNHPSRISLTKPSKAGPVWTGEVRLNEGWLDQPLRWKRPRRIFVCAHGDLFHESVPDGWIDKVFAVMALAPQHTFQVLTKRAARMREYLAGDGRDLYERVLVEGNKLRRRLNLRADVGINNPATVPLRNVWLGVSVERQQEADQRIPDLLATPAAMRFLSCEPLLGPVDRAGLSNVSSYRGEPIIDWVIAGGEGGPHARPSHPDWFRSLRNQCQAAGVPFFFKQWGEWKEFGHDVDGPQIEEVDAGSDYADAIAAAAHRPAWITLAGDVYHDQRSLPEDAHCRLVERVGKARAGALLDGREHRAMPR